ncbi:hypothetical protein [Burkholderia ubonensis]|uniref:hypothetical protein n=1 Tax=Burkholderia ubonensis TaxID=101571 RepID=UPI0007596C95|nr:hypothetical protein [Burkholderia ubonensis]KVD63266.1 hypothetical protein WI88_09990 [Burkholderia ubonensis]
MYFKGLLAHSDTVSESVFLVAETFHLAHAGAQAAYPNSRIVWLFPIDEEDVPAYIRGSTEEPVSSELLDLSRFGL